MNVANIQSFQIGEEIGHGGCGQVYEGKSADGHAVAIKMLDGLSIAREVMETAYRRLEQGGWPDGVLRVVSADLASGQRFFAYPLLLESLEDGTVRGRSLQHHIAELSRERTWSLVRDIAESLSEMHRRRVVHGNLKPGNILIGDEGEIYLSDAAMGNMPGVHVFHFTDALLYQSPEQLLQQEGYFNEEGYRWDVYAFGSLAFRLLTGKFARCDETFSIVAPKPGETHNDRLQADLAKIARNLELSERLPWPDQPKDEKEKDLRAWIDLCLEIDPHLRPATMMQVHEGFTAVDKDHAEKHAYQALENRRKNTARLLKLASMGFLGAAVVAVVLGSLWMLTGIRLGMKQAELSGYKKDTTQKLTKAYSVRDDALAKATTAQKEQAYEKELWKSRLQASRQVGDNLFAWAMEKGHRKLPPLDGREVRLKRLENYFQDFVEKTASLKDLKNENARARMELSEISLAMGDAPKAAERLDTALAAWDQDMPMNAELKLRVARNTLLLALLRQENGSEKTLESFAAARESLENVPRGEVDSTRLDQLFAVLDFNEARSLAANGQDAKALEQLMHATTVLNRLTEEKPDMAILHSELANCYLSSATILDGMGNMGDAREVRTLAANQLASMLKLNPSDDKLTIELAGCYGSIAESNALSGDVTGASNYSTEALKLLDRILLKEPENTEALIRKAAQLGILAGIERDRGDATKARKLYDEAIHMLEPLAATDVKNAMLLYRLGLLEWESGRLDGTAGDRKSEEEQIKRAKGMLETVETLRGTNGPRPEQLSRAQAYLAGDLALCLQLLERKDEAKEVFGEAIDIWENLAKSRPGNEEYTEALSWCRDMVKELNQSR